MNVKKYPLVSIMIATYNSSWILRKPLDAIMRQTYPKDKIEILIIDGGSTDTTRVIATEYGCRIIDNPATDPVSAKFLGIQNARGRYLLTIDHDEVLSNSSSIENRILALLNNPDCKVARLTGYQCPKGFCGLSEYTSEFGDPFTLFYYRSSQGYHYYHKTCCKVASIYSDNNEYTIFCFDKGLSAFFIELVCLGTIIDLSYFKDILHADIDKNGLTHLFYKMVDHGEKSIIVSKNDPLDHYSVDSISSFLPKLRWRIINNVHYADRAAQGFSGRVLEANSSSFKKYLFPLYSFSLLFPFFDAVYLSLTRHNISFMWHPILCLYVTGYIIYQYIRKILKIPPKLKSYDGKNVVG